MPEVIVTRSAGSLFNVVEKVKKSVIVAVSAPKILDQEQEAGASAKSYRRQLIADLPATSLPRLLLKTCPLKLSEGNRDAGQNSVHVLKYY